MVVEITTVGPRPRTALKSRSPEPGLTSPGLGMMALVPEAHPVHPPRPKSTRSVDASAAYVNRNATRGPTSSFNAKVNAMQCWHLDGKKIDRSFDTPKDDHLVANPRLVRRISSVRRNNRGSGCVSRPARRNLSNIGGGREGETLPPSAEDASSGQPRHQLQLVYL